MGGANIRAIDASSIISALLLTVVLDSFVAHRDRNGSLRTVLSSVGHVFSYLFGDSLIPSREVVAIRCLNTRCCRRYRAIRNAGIYDIAINVLTARIIHGQGTALSLSINASLVVDNGKRIARIVHSYRKIAFRHRSGNSLLIRRIARYLRRGHVVLLIVHIRTRVRRCCGITSIRILILDS